VTLVDTLAAAAYVAKATGRPCPPARIRKWAHQGLIVRRGREMRRTLYAVEDLDVVLDARGVAGP
jgi:hypothetical protein